MKNLRSPNPKKVAFQGVLGAYSHLSCQVLFPDVPVVSCRTFEDALRSVEDEKADLALLPVENSTAGRVADLHHLLLDTSLHIVCEYYQPIQHCLMGIKGSNISAVTHVFSHLQALSQCRKSLKNLSIEPVQFVDTAGAAEWVFLQKDKTKAAIASHLAAEKYGLEIFQENLQDEPHNTTRFLGFMRKPITVKSNISCKTSLLFQVRSIPAALYKVLGGFATNGVNLIKLESYLIGGQFTVACFYAEIEGHPDNRSVALALEEISFFSDKVRIVGVYPIAHERSEQID